MRRQKKQTQPKNEDQLLLTARRAALRVEFIDTIEELRLYTRAIHAALLWGKKVSVRKRIY